MKSFKNRIRSIVMSESRRQSKADFGSNAFRKQMIRNIVEDCGLDLEKEEEAIQEQVAQNTAMDNVMGFFSERPGVQINKLGEGERPS